MEREFGAHEAEAFVRKLDFNDVVTYLVSMAATAITLGVGGVATTPCSMLFGSSCC